MKSSNFGQWSRMQRDVKRGTRGDATRSTRLVTIRVNCPAVAAPTRHRRCYALAAASARRLHGRPALTWSLIPHSVVALSRLARTWCNYSPQFRVPLSVTVTLRLCPPNARCIQLAHYALHLVSPLACHGRGSQLRFDACGFVSLFFCFSFLLILF